VSAVGCVKPRIMGGGTSRGLVRPCVDPRQPPPTRAARIHSDLPGVAKDVRHGCVRTRSRGLCAQRPTSSTPGSPASDGLVHCRRTARERRPPGLLSALTCATRTDPCRANLVRTTGDLATSGLG
jgi:hypothetical protein